MRSASVADQPSPWLPAKTKSSPAASEALLSRATLSKTAMPRVTFTVVEPVAQNHMPPP